jgi:tetratricopeptide (TPR) repeat protein
VAEGRLEAAESAYRGALAGAASPLNRGAVLVNLAECLLLRGRLHEAERTVREAERLAVVHRVTPLLPYVYRGLGAVARARGDEEGFVFYEQALDLCHESGTPPVELATTQHEYALLDRDQGRLDLATARLREAITIYRRLGTRAELARAEAELAALRGEGRGEEESGEAAASAAPTSGE